MIRRHACQNEMEEGENVLFATGELFPSYVSCPKTERKWIYQRNGTIHLSKTNRVQSQKVWRFKYDINLGKVFKWVYKKRAVTSLESKWLRIEDTFQKSVKLRMFFGFLDISWTYGLLCSRQIWFERQSVLDLYQNKEN